MGPADLTYRDRHDGPGHRRSARVGLPARPVRAQPTLHTEIGTTDPVIGDQRVSAFQRDPSGFKHVPIVAGFERFGDALLDQQQGDPILAIERRDAVEDQIGHCRRPEERQINNDTAYLSYINRTVAAAKTLHLGILQDFEIPSHRTNLWDAYQEFNTIVEHYMVQIQIVHGRRVRGYSVHLDPCTKSKIRHYLEKIREIVDRLEVPLPKKEALTARITALSDEVDRDRTRFDAYAGLALEMAAAGGEVAQRLNPVLQVPRRHRGSSGVRKAGRGRPAQLARSPRAETPYTTPKGTVAGAETTRLIGRRYSLLKPEFQERGVPARQRLRATERLGAYQASSVPQHQVISA
jgi:hypothetical protein